MRYIVLDEAHIYEGAEGATAVLGTQLFEQLPSEEMAPPSTDGRLFRQAECRTEFIRPAFFALQAYP